MNCKKDAFRSTVAIEEPRKALQCGSKQQ